MSTPKVYEAITRVMQAMSVDGIAKGRRNNQQGYAFRGIDDIYNCLSTVLAENHLCILPRVLTSDTVERESKKGGALFYTTMKVEFDLVSSEDGSKHTVCMAGEGMDSADKSSNKAMSAAYKYACLQVFCIPTEGDNDADATTHDVVPTQDQNHVPGAPTAQQINTLKVRLQNGAMRGTTAFTTVWKQNKGPVRDHIASDAKLMDGYRQTAQRADAAAHAEGDDAGVQQPETSGAA